MIMPLVLWLFMFAMPRLLIMVPFVVAALFFVTRHQAAPVVSKLGDHWVRPLSNCQRVSGVTHNSNDIDHFYVVR